LPLKIIKNIKTLTPEASWVFLEQIGTVLAGLMGVKLLTSVLDTAEFGYLALANSIMALIGMNLYGPFKQGLMRFWAISKDSETLDVFYAVSNRLAKYVCGFTLLIIPIIFFLLYIFKNPKWATLVAISLAAGGLTGLFGLRVGIFVAARQRRRSALLNIASAFSRFFIALCLLILIYPGAIVAISGYALTSFIFFLIAQRFYSAMASKNACEQAVPDKRLSSYQSLSKEIFSYSWPFLAWGLFGWINVSSDKWALQTFYGAETVGAFAVVSLLASYPLIMFSGFLTSLFTPIAFQRAGDLQQSEKKSAARRVILFMAGVYILGTGVLLFLIYLFHYDLVLFISNERFAQFSHLLPGLTIAWAFFCLGNILAPFGFLVNKTRIYIIPITVSGCLAVLMTFYFCRNYGPYGVVWGLGISRFVYAVWCVRIAIRIIQE